MGDAKIEMVVHATALEAVRQMFSFAGSDLTENCRIGGVDENGSEQEFTIEQMVDGIELQGYWGFADETNHTVHVWENKTASEENLLFFLGHEMGHLCEADIRDSDPIADEHRADDYGRAAVQAYRMLKQLRPEVAHV
jgi:hypothetical protein